MMNGIKEKTDSVEMETNPNGLSTRGEKKTEQLNSNYESRNLFPFWCINRKFTTNKKKK